MSEREGEELVIPLPEGFEMSIPNLQTSLHEWAIRKEWRGPKSSQRPIVADLGLFHTEVSEAFECLRINADPKARWYTYTVWLHHVKFPNLSAEQVEVLTGSTPEELDLVPKPEGVGSELADLCIRVFETAEEYGLDIEWEIAEKQKYNEQREIKHGGKLM